MGLFGKIFGFLKLSTRGVARAIGRVFARGLLKLGRSVSEIANAMVERGIEYNRKLMMEDIGTMEMEKVSQDIITNLPRSYLPPRESIIDTDLRRGRKYFMRFRVRVIDERTGEIREDWKSMYSDEYKTISEYEKEYADFWNERYKISGVRLYSVKLKQMFHNRGFRW